MLPNLNFNPSFANLAAIHGLGGNFAHPVRPGPMPIGNPVGVAPHIGGPMPGPMPVWQPPNQYSDLPVQATAPMQGYPQGNLNNLRAIMQMFGQRQMTY